MYKNSMFLVFFSVKLLYFNFKINTVINFSKKKTGIKINYYLVNYIKMLNNFNHNKNCSSNW